MESRIDQIITARPGLEPEPSVLYNDPAPMSAAEPKAEPELHESEIESKPIQQETTPEYDIPEEKQETKEKVSNLDEYGNEVQSKERVYTESEVQAMIRDRLSRGRQQEQTPQPQQPQQTQQSNEDWEVQLEQFIDQTLEKRTLKQQEQQWQRQEQENQAQFEVRFNQGMAKYPDFERVVMDKPLTPQMVIATRGMQDPAAFIYAAAKTQAPELERISRIQDPISQVVELGRLEERMRKSRAAVSQSPRPIDMIKGDVPDKVERTWNIDDKLRQDEDRTKADRMRGRTI